VQNAKVYGQDPEFHASAWRTIGNTVRRIMVLMNKLSTQTTVSEEKLPQSFQRMNINDLVRETLESLNGTPCTPRFIAGNDLPLDHPKEVDSVLAFTNVNKLSNSTGGQFI